MMDNEMSKKDDGIKVIEHNGEMVGMCIKAGHNWEKTEFLTSDDMSQQLGLLAYDREHSVKPHAHHKVPRTINYTSEVLFCVSGKIVYTFYDPKNDWAKIDSCQLQKGDTLCLFGAGHGARAIEPTKLIEIKQGPYLGTKDKYFYPEEKFKK